jgi:hypothetical protein
MKDPIRVRAKDTGHEMTIPEARFDADAFQKVDKPALDAHGEPAPVKYRTSVAKSASDNKAAKSVDQNKEN